MIETSAAATSTNATNLLPFTAYSATVRVRNNVGLGPASAAVAFETLEDVPSAPTNLNAIATRCDQGALAATSVLSA